MSYQAGVRSISREQGAGIEPLLLTWQVFAPPRDVPHQPVDYASRTIGLIVMPFSLSSAA
jgi:hypothetical protein